MATLSSAQIKTYAQQAGFQGDVVDTMVAIAYAESGGDPRSHNSTPPDDSYGLWQINMIGSLGPARRKEFGIKDNTELFDPAVNAKAAYKVYKSSGLKAWTTYTSGKYKQFLNGASDTTGHENDDPQQGLLAGITSSINAFGTNVFNGIENVAGILVAVALVLAGIALLVVNSKSGLVKKAAKLTPIGKVVS